MCMCAYIYIYIYAHIQTRVCERVCVQMYTYVHIQIYINIFIYIYIALQLREHCDRRMKVDRAEPDETIRYVRLSVLRIELKINKYRCF